MNPYFFGDSRQPLFGAYHPPRGKTSLGCGVLLCYPIGQEYMRCHRAYRQLANLLTRRGLHVFRFDYFGTGDSAGESDEGRPSVWRVNIGDAIEELQSNAAIDRVSLVGLRLGGALAALASAGRDDVDQLVLWDPVVNGAAYLRELAAVADEPVDAGSDTVGVLGFPLTAMMRDEIEKIELTELHPMSVGEVAIFVASENERARELKHALEERDCRACYQCVPSAGSWNEVDNFGGALVPQEIIRGIVDRLAAGRSGS